MPPIASTSSLVPPSSTGPSTLLTLHFPTFSSHFSKSHLEIISSTVKFTSSLTVLVESEYVDLLSWEEMEIFLRGIYERAHLVYLIEGRILDEVDVVLSQLRRKKLEEEFEKKVEFIASDTLEQHKILELKEERFRVGAMGGTFDHLHIGHKILLTMAALITTERLIVGISDTVLLKNKKFSEFLETLEIRQDRVIKFMEKIKPNLKVDTPALQDVFGPTAWDSEVSVCIVSEETKSGGLAINAERQKVGLSTLKIYVIPLVAAETRSTNQDEGKVENVDKMGSTGIREWLSKK